MFFVDKINVENLFYDYNIEINILEKYDFNVVYIISWIFYIV